MFNRILLRLALGLAVSAASAQAAISTCVRPDFENLSGPASVSGRDPNPGLIWMQGLITTVAKAPTDGGGFFLTEASFGQPFSPYIFPLTSDLTDPTNTDRKSTRLNSSHLGISYAV